ncbi:MAG: hypothetical protein PHT88_02205 [Candidatus Moranbacteria bacterium]|nr:hypothetical protein [Candidatus Moranbacteria bacterium]
MMMDEQSKKFFVLLALIAIFSAGFSYYRFIYSLTYDVSVGVACDPKTQSCFVAQCDPEAEECTGDPTEDTSYYAILHKEARNMPDCDPNDDACQAMLVCQEGERKCSVTYCDETTVAQGERCSDESDIVPEEEEEVLIDESVEGAVSEEEIPAQGESSEPAPAAEQSQEATSVVPVPTGTSEPPVLY